MNVKIGCPVVMFGSEVEKLCCVVAATATMFAVHLEISSKAEDSGIGSLAAVATHTRNSTVVYIPSLRCKVIPRVCVLCPLSLLYTK